MSNLFQRAALFFFVTWCTIHVNIAIAQKPTQNFACWPGAELYFPFIENGKWGFMFETYEKGNKFIAESQGNFYRLGATYYFKNGNRLGAGLAYQWNVPYDDVSLPYGWPDYRIWENYIIRHTRADGNRLWMQRIRLEQRWLGRKENLFDNGFSSYDFEQTLRYMLRYQLWFKPRWSFAVYDEVHLRTLASEAEKILDQNRLYAGMVYALDPKREFRIEVGYMNQSFWKSADTEEGRSRVNHTLRISITSDYPLKRAAVKNQDNE